MIAADLSLASQAGRQAGRWLLLCPEHALGTPEFLCTHGVGLGPSLKTSRDYIEKEGRPLFLREGRD